MANKDDELYELALQKAGDKPVYNGTYEGQLNDIFDKIQNREKFSYDINADPLYDMFKDRYIQQGKLAMKDTMGQAAALTGGYGSTYGQQVGQQTYDAYLQNLGEVIPELYGMAYDRYKDEGDQLNDLYGKVGQLRDEEYGRWRDDMGDWENEFQRLLQNERYEREYADEREQESYNRQQTADAIARQMEQQEYDRRMTAEEIARQQEILEYNRRMAEDETLYNRQKYDRETAEATKQQMYSNLYALIKASGYRPTDAELAASGMTREAADALASEYNRGVAMENAQLAARYSSSGSSGSTARSSGSSGSSGSYSSGSGSSYGSSDPYGGTPIAGLPQYYEEVNSAAVQLAKQAAANRGSTSNAGTLPIIQAVRSDDTLTPAQKSTITQNIVTNANAGVNRSALGSPTATVNQNMGGTTQGSKNIMQRALDKLKNLFK